MTSAANLDHAPEPGAKASSELVIEGLRASVLSREVLSGVDLVVRSGEVHAVMGPNGAGKSTLSHVLMGRPGYEIIGGSASLDGVDLLSLAPWERARLGLFLAPQYPTEVPGVGLRQVLVAATGGQREESLMADIVSRAESEAKVLGMDAKLLDRSINVDLSGGERKRSETVQLAVLRPAIAILDEIDSGLDVDGLGLVARRVHREVEEQGLGVLAITHYKRLLAELKPDYVHVLVDGKIVKSGGAELAEELETTGYAAHRG